MTKLLMDSNVVLDTMPEHTKIVNKQRGFSIMKKCISFMMVIFLLLCVFLPVSANEEYVNSFILKDTLITHYDFEGDTLSVQTSDKATGGKSVEVITTTESTFTSGQATISNSIATITGSNGMNSYFNNTSDTVKGADFRNNTTGEYTFYFSFRVDGDNQSTGGFLDVMKTSGQELRVYASTCNTTAKTMNLIARITNSANTSLKNGVTVATIPYTYEETNTDTFMHFMWSMKYDTNAQVWKHNCYFSSDGLNFIKVLEEEAADANTFFSGVTALHLGNKNANRKDCIEYFDDFRIYNRALSVEEIKLDIGVTGVVCHGVQTSLIQDDTYSVRFVGSIDSLEYDQVGFQVTVQDGKRSWNVPASCVYDSLLANEDDGVKSYQAAELRGMPGYLYALTIKNIPVKDESGADLTVTFVVTPYYIIEGSEPVNGTSYTIVYTAGEYQSSAINPEA